MLSYISVLALPTREQEARALIMQPIVQSALMELALPELVFQDATPHLLYENVGRAIYSEEDGRASFSLPKEGPRIILGEYFFSSPDTEWKSFTLFHEIRHAYQFLVDATWKQFCEEKRVVFRQNQGFHRKALKLFLGGLQEFDAQAYACCKCPGVSSRIILRESEMVVSHLQKSESSSVIGTLACLGYLPYVYEWERLIYEQYITNECVHGMQEASRFVRSFLLRRTPLESDQRALEICEAYLCSTEKRYMDIAKQFIQHLSSWGNATS